MTRHLHRVLLIAAIGVIVMFSNLGGTRLWDRDEPRNAGCAAEMAARGDWITPVFNGELRTHKPILLYWLMLSAYGVLGETEFAARFWSAALAIGTALLTYGMGRRLFSPAVGLWSAVILVTTLMFGVAGRAATPDSVLIFWSTAAMWVYVRGTAPAADDSGARSGPWRWFPSWPMAALMYACMGMAVLAKGPVGVVLPTAVVGAFLLVRRLPPRAADAGNGKASRWARGLAGVIHLFGPRHFCRTCWLMRPVTALLVVAIVALPWYVAVDLRTDGQWVRGFLLDHNLGRAAQSLEGHGGSILYYPVALLVGFFPWSVFAVPTLLEATRRIRGRDPEASGYVLAACWAAVYVGAFSVARTKLPSYITPCYPAVAMLVGSYLHAWTRGWQLSAPFWPRLALATLAVVGAGIVAATWFSAARYLPGDSWLAGLGLVPFTAGIAALVLVFRADARRAAARVFAGGAIAFSLLLFSVAAARVDRHQTFDSFVAIMKQRTRHAELGALGVLEPSWVYYTNRHVDLLFLPELHPGLPRDQVHLGAPRVRDWEPRPLTHAWHYLRETPDRFLITTRQLLDRVGTLPDGIEVVAETEYFLRSDRLVLLAADCAPPHAMARGQTDSTAQSRH